MTRFTNKFQFDSNGLPALDANAAVLNEHYADLMQSSATGVGYGSSTMVARANWRCQAPR